MPRRSILFLLACTLLVRPADATWSIVVVDRHTGEVGVAAATCIPRTNLLMGLTTVVVGVGGGVVQSAGDPADLVPMTAGLRARLAPADILALVIDAEPAPRVLQTGIVALYDGVPVTFSGEGVGRAKLGVVGEVGDLAYAIQGNVLAGSEVVEAAEATLLATGGDLGQRLLAAMVAARELGGDGRCSCSMSRPASCGAPPPDFEKSAHCGFLVVARIGDPDAPCLTGSDCVSNDVYLRLNIRGQDAAENDPDPVDQLVERYATWRANRAGRPDGILSRVDAVEALPADGRTKRQVVVKLVDVDGVPLDHGGASVRVRAVDGARSRVAVGPVVDLGDGSYRFSITASRNTGTDRFAISAADDLVEATLYPYLEVRSDPPAALHIGESTLSASTGGRVSFALAPAAPPGAPYLLLASASGTRPGLPLPGPALLPLNRDPWFLFSLRAAGDPRVLPGSVGALDADGRAEAELVAPPGALTALIGSHLSWAAVCAGERGAVVTDAVELAITP